MGEYALLDLGRRVERLFYFGAILLLLCCLELYFVSAAVYVRTENPSDIAALTDRLTQQQSRLQQLFESPPRLPSQEPDNDRDQRIREMRVRLGLPPPVASVRVPEPETYADALGKILASLPTERKLTPETVSLLDSRTSPQKILENLETRRKHLIAQPVNVWGIESPVVIPMQYGSAQYQVPASFIASSLLLALAPLVFAWIVSIQTTRQRELLVIRGLRDFKAAFPHVLNVFLVDFSNTLEILRRDARRRNKWAGAEMMLSRVLNAFFRSSVLLFFAGPMVFLLVYSAFQLSNPMEASMATLAGVGLFGLMLLFVTLHLVVQECLLLWDKIFYA